MTKRQALLAIFALPLGYVGAFKVKAQFKAQAERGLPGVLRVPLDDWAGMEIEYAGRSIHFTSAELFTILGGKRR